MWLDWQGRRVVPPSSANGMGVGMTLSCAPARGASFRWRNQSLSPRSNQSFDGVGGRQSKAARACHTRQPLRSQWEIEPMAQPANIGRTGSRT